MSPATRLRNELRQSTDPAFLRQCAADPRSAVSLPAIARMRKLGIPWPEPVAPVGRVKSCPKCGVTGDIETLFGLRRMTGTGKVLPQSQCRRCRSGKPPLVDGVTP